MKVLSTIILAVFFLNTTVHTYDLTITIPNIKNTKGAIHVSVYNNKNKDKFTKIGYEFRVLDFKAESAKGKYIIKDLPEGEYAIAIYHDENDDKKCNTNLIGIPKEGYGFPKITKLFSAPKFDDCKIVLDRDVSVPITLIY